MEDNISCGIQMCEIDITTCIRSEIIENSKYWKPIFLKRIVSHVNQYLLFKTILRLTNDSCIKVEEHKLIFYCCSFNMVVECLNWNVQRWIFGN